MIKKASALTLAGAMGVAGVGAGAVLGSGVAGAATTTTTAVKDRVSSIKDALSGLVTDGTLTQAQADKVASTLDSKLPGKGPFGGGHGGFGPGGFGGPGRFGGLSDAASVIGITKDALRTGLESGKTLAQLAQTKGISKADLISRLVTAAKADLAAAVKDGKLTQAQSDTISANLQARITKEVDAVREPGEGPRGFGGRHGGRGPGDWKPGTTVPVPTTPTPAPSTTAS